MSGNLELIFDVQDLHFPFAQVEFLGQTRCTRILNHKTSIPIITFNYTARLGTKSNFKVWIYHSNNSTEIKYLQGSFITFI